MPIRLLPALCAGLMLAACADGAPGQATPTAPPMLSEATTPGEISGGGHNNVGNTIYFATDSAALVAEAQAQLQREAEWLSTIRSIQ